MKKEDAHESVAQKAIQVLQQHGLLDHKGRPFDNRFALFDPSTRGKPKLIFIGYNGNSSDACWTNRTAIEHGRYNPEFSNLVEGLKPHRPWGKTPLPGNLRRLTCELGFSHHETIYTNAVLECSKDAPALKRAMSASEFARLVNGSMNFFRDFTLQFVRPAAIVVYGNGQHNSTASIVKSKLGEEVTSFILDDAAYWRKAYWFEGKTGILENGSTSKVPVLCITHLSRWLPSEGTILQFRRIIQEYTP